MKPILIAVIVFLLLNSASGCTLIAAGIASGASDAADGSEHGAQNKAPVVRVENDVHYSEPVGRRGK